MYVANFERDDLCTKGTVNENDVIFWSNLHTKELFFLVKQYLLGKKNNFSKKYDFNFMLFSIMKGINLFFKESYFFPNGGK